MKYYQLRRPVYDEYGFAGFEDYHGQQRTIEEARKIKNLSAFADIRIFEITVEEQIVE